MFWAVIPFLKVLFSYYISVLVLILLGCVPFEILDSIYLYPGLSSFHLRATFIRKSLYETWFILKSSRKKSVNQSYICTFHRLSQV